MDLSEKLRNADKMLLDGYTGQAVVAAGQVLEELLQQLYQTLLPKLKSKDQRTVSEKLEQIGKGKAVTELTLGQLVGLFRYFERAQADTTVVNESTLERQTLDFIQTLSTEVTHASHVVMIYSLRASAGDAFGNVALLNMLDHLPPQRGVQSTM